MSRKNSLNQARKQITFREPDERSETETDTMYYITLTIEEENGGGGSGLGVVSPVTLVPGQLSPLAHGHDSDVDSNTYSQVHGVPI